MSGELDGMVQRRRGGCNEAAPWHREDDAHGRWWCRCAADVVRQRGSMAVKVEGMLQMAGAELRGRGNKVGEMVIGHTIQGGLGGQWCSDLVASRSGDKVPNGYMPHDNLGGTWTKKDDRWGLHEEGAE
jgi:hypothetical protein